MDVNELRSYRKKLYTDLFTNVIPDRVPVQDGLGVEYLIQYSGRNLLCAQYEYSEEMLIDVYDKAAREVLRGDTLGAGYARNAVGIMMDQNVANRMGASGFIQHPEVSCMSPDEYDEFIENPYDFFLEKVSPRQSRQVAKGGAFRSRAVLMRYLSAMDQNAAFANATSLMAERYGFHREPAGSSSITQPPFDIIADFCRGFSHIPMDMRRCPEKLHAAMDAIMPFILRMGVPANPNVLGSAKIMTHMPAFLSLKQYEEFYLPQFVDQHHIYAEKGIYLSDFLEQDWTRFVDSLDEMPMGTRFYMEKGDPKKFKDGLGKKFVLGGMYPIAMLRSGTKEQCIDKAKELLDIMAPGGNYYFCMDKSALSLEDVNVENYIAVLEYIKENYHYDNAGELVNTELKREDTIVTGKAKKYPEFKSKYILTFDEYKKEYPPVDDIVEPYMRKAYDKYIAKLGWARDF